MTNQFFSTFKAIFKKEILHIKRDSAVLSFAIVFPIMELLLLGYILDVNIRNINVVVYDMSNTQESRTLLNKISSTGTFQIVKVVGSDEELYKSITKGQAKVAIKIPVDYSKTLLEKTTSSIMVLIDGSNAVITSESINSLNGLTLKESMANLLEIDELRENKKYIPLTIESNVLFNPNIRSANFFLPGLIVWELPMVTVILISLSFVAEKEKGTFDQLAVTPLHPLGYVIGKAIPYILLALLLIIEICLVTKYVFDVSINGSVILLLLLSLPCIITNIGISICVSAGANTQIDAIQVGTILRVFPPFYFTGYFFPLDSSPQFFEIFTRFIPERHLMEICRGIILRGATLEHLWQHGLILLIMALLSISLATLIYKKKVA